MNVPGSVTGLALPIRETRLEKKLQRELNLSGALRALYQTQCRAVPRIRRIQNWRICQVDRLGSELQLLMLREVEELIEAHVECMQTRTRTVPTPHVPKLPGFSGANEAGSNH